MMPRALMEVIGFSAIQTIYEFTYPFSLKFCYRRGHMHTNKLANPGPLGLMGFGMTTVLLNLHNAGFFPLNSSIISMGIFFGGLAQIMAGLLEYKKGNTFGMTAFISYGSFWLSLVGLLLLPRLGLAEPTDASVLGIYLALWGVFTLFMFFGTLRANRVLQFVFGSLTLLFALLDRVLPKMIAKERKAAGEPPILAAAKPHALLVGYGRVGKLVAEGLKARTPLVVIEDDPERAEALRKDAGLKK